MTHSLRNVMIDLPAELREVDKVKHMVWSMASVLVMLLALWCVLCL